MTHSCERCLTTDLLWRLSAITRSITPTHSLEAMAASAAEEDANMEELMYHGLGMDETTQSPDRRPSLKESFHSDSLLAPDTDFMTGEKTSSNRSPTQKKTQNLTL